MTKYLLTAAAAAALMAVAAPASAQTVSGTVNITGNVQPTCTVTSSAGAAGTLGGTIALGTLNDSDGTLRDDYIGSTFSSPAGAKLNYTVKCTSTSATVSVDADAIATGSGTPPAGYARSIDFVGSVEVDRAGTTAKLFSNNSSGAALSASPLEGSISNTDNNVRIAIHGLSTAAASDVLLSGTYAGQVVVSIAPSA